MSIISRIIGQAPAGGQFGDKKIYEKQLMIAKLPQEVNFGDINIEEI
jgi:hypothetical protein